MLDGDEVDSTTNLEPDAGDSVTGSDGERHTDTCGCSAAPGLPRGAAWFLVLGGLLVALQRR